MAEMPYEREALRYSGSAVAGRSGKEESHGARCKGAACPAFAICQARRAAALGRLDEGYPGGTLA